MTQSRSPRWYQGLSGCNPDPWSPVSISIGFCCYKELWPQAQVRLSTGPSIILRMTGLASSLEKYSTQPELHSDHGHCPDGRTSKRKSKTQTCLHCRVVSLQNELCLSVSWWQGVLRIVQDSVQKHNYMIKCWVLPGSVRSHDYPTWEGVG